MEMDVIIIYLSNVPGKIYGDTVKYEKIKTDDRLLSLVWNSFKYKGF
jgi:hypothetical protein